MNRNGSVAFIVILIVLVLIIIGGVVWYYQAHDHSFALKNSAQTAIDSSDWKSYLSQYNDFEIKYPSTWQVIETSTEYSGGGLTNEPSSGGWTDIIKSSDGSSSIVIYSSPNSPGASYKDESSTTTAQITFAGMAAEQYAFPDGEWIVITDNNVQSYGPWIAGDGENRIEVTYGSQNTTTTEILSSFEFVHSPVQ